MPLGGGRLRPATNDASRHERWRRQRRQQCIHRRITSTSRITCTSRRLRRTSRHLRRTSRRLFRTSRRLFRTSRRHRRTSRRLRRTSRRARRRRRRCRLPGWRHCRRRLRLPRRHPRALTTPPQSRLRHLHLGGLLLGRCLRNWRQVRPLAPTACRGRVVEASGAILRQAAILRRPRTRLHPLYIYIFLQRTAERERSAAWAVQARGR